MPAADRPTGRHLPASDQFEVTAFPPYWVARLNARYAMEMEKKLKKLGLDVSRWRVAMLLRVHGALSMSQIAEHAVGKLPTITKIVYRMQDEGLVNVTASETDRRVSVVALTPQGHQTVSAVIATTQALFQRLFRGVSPAEIDTLNATLSRMLDNLSD